LTGLKQSIIDYWREVVKDFDEAHLSDFKRLDFSVFKGFPANFSVPGFSGGGAGLPPPPGVLDFSNTNF
jgi:hypothetical protein